MKCTRYSRSPQKKREWLAQYPYHSLARVEETLARDSVATATARVKAGTAP